MALVSKIIRELVWLLSEIEAHLYEYNGKGLHFRRLYMSLQGVKYGQILSVGRGLRLLNADNLTLGERCALGDFVRIENYAPIVIGDDFLGATGLHLNSGTHAPISLEPKQLPIQIGDRVWCGINVSILAGVRIGNDVVIGAGSLVCNNIPSNSIAVGVPARVIKPLDRESSKDVWTWVSPNTANDSLPNSTD
jgi:acetyltransferase-like isoleucine patch superfamily enzyme